MPRVVQWTLTTAQNTPVNNPISIANWPITENLIHLGDNGITTGIKTVVGTAKTPATTSVTFTFRFIPGGTLYYLNNPANFTGLTYQDYAATDTVMGAILEVKALLQDGANGLTAIKTRTNNIYDILNHGTYGNSAIRSLIVTLDTVADNIYSIVNGTSGNAAIKTVVDAINTNVTAIKNLTEHATNGLAAIKSAIVTIDNEVGIADGVVDTILARLDHATYGLSALKTLIDTAGMNIITVDSVVDTINTSVANVDADLVAAKAVIDSISAALTSGSGETQLGVISNKLNAIRFLLNGTTF